MRAKSSKRSPQKVLRRVTLAHLFRVGANLDPQAARPSAERDGEEDGEEEGAEEGAGVD